MSAKNLFFITAFIILVFGLLMQDTSSALDLDDFYFVVSNMHIGIIISLLTTTTGIIYTVFERINRPIADSVGLWHFTLFALGLGMLSSPWYVYPVSSSGIDHLLRRDTFFDVFYTLAFVFFLLSLMVFAFGILRALLNGNNKQAKSVDK